MVKTHWHGTEDLQVWACGITYMHVWEGFSLHLSFNWLKHHPQTCSVQQLCINLLCQHAEQSVNTFDLLEQLLPGHGGVVRVPQLNLHPGQSETMTVGPNQIHVFPKEQVYPKTLKGQSVSTHSQGDWKFRSPQSISAAFSQTTEVHLDLL